jgi:glycerate kinase
MAPDQARFVVAPDSFKGSYTAPEVAAAIARGIEHAGSVVAAVCPVADGGEGTMPLLVERGGGRFVTAPTHDPLGRQIEARFALLDSGATAGVDTAEASGLDLVGRGERDAERASTRGTGELIAAAVATGAKRILVGAGGSASTDGGAGAIEAIEEAGGLRSATLEVLCDVETPFEEAATAFGPQKGAGPDAVERLTERLRAQAATLPRDPTGVPMTGCAGGLSGGLWAAFDATLRPGADYVFETLGVADLLRDADGVITGEGRLDDQSFAGKVVGALARLCREADVGLHVITGDTRIDPGPAAALGLTSVQVAATLDGIEEAARRIGADYSPAIG